MLTTWRRVAVSVPTSAPESVTALPRTRLGSIRTPPLAMVLIAAAICSALTDIDCPKEIRSSVWLVHMLGEGRMPGVSPITPTPVRVPRPKASR